MGVKYLSLVVMLVTVFGVYSSYGQFLPNFRHHFDGSGFFGNRVSAATLPQYIVQIFRSKHFPFYRQGSGNQYFRAESYPINFVPDYLRRNKQYGFGRYTSYLSRVFGHRKNGH